MTDIIPIVVTCGVGADLFALPLVFCTLMTALGFADTHENVTWIGTWWMVCVSTAVLAGEVAIDTMADRRRKFFKRTWPVAQYAGSGVVTLVVVLALSKDMSDPERLVALGASLASVGIIKAGLIERFKSFVDFFGG